MKLIAYPAILGAAMLLKTAEAFSPTSMNRRRFGVVHTTDNNNINNAPRAKKMTVVYMGNKVGIFFGTSTGSTSEAADLLYEAFGDDVSSEPIEIDGIQGSVAKTFEQFDALVVGTPTWNTGADSERSGTGWDEIYYGEMQDLNLAGKKVAVFGLGDQISYSENYADASGELYDVFEGLGCKMMGHTSQEGYEHESSKAIRGDKFCGLLLDAVNQEELTEERVQKWVAQLKEEGILEGGSSAGGVSSAAAPDVAVAAKTESAVVEKNLEENSRILEENIMAHSGKNEGDSKSFTPHYNPVTGRTMWTSADGRSCYFTVDAPKVTSKFSP